MDELNLEPSEDGCKLLEPSLARTHTRREDTMQCVSVICSSSAALYYYGGCFLCPSFLIRFFCKILKHFLG